MGILDAPATPRASIADSLLWRAPQRQPFATRSKVMNALAELSNGTDLWGNYCTRHVAMQDVSGLWLHLPNSINNGGAEADGPNDITVKATIWDPADLSQGTSGTFIPVHFNGRRSASVEPGPGITSDFIPLALYAGGVFYVRVLVTVASTGQKWPLSMPVRYSQEGFVTGVGTPTDLTDSGTITNAGGRLYSATLLGLPVAPRVSVEVAGDSINDGIGDTDPDQGWATTALTALGVPFQQVCLPSELANTFRQGRLRRRRISVSEGCRVSVTNHGINDLISTFSANQLKDSLIALWRARAVAGLFVVQNTITPRTSSTDSWATTTNQTPNLPGNGETYRVEVNNWLRDGAPVDPTTLAKLAIGAAGLRAGQPGHPLGYVFDMADATESARNSGQWRVDLGASTTDGTHPSAAVHAAMSTAFQTAWPTILAAARTSLRSSALA